MVPAGWMNSLANPAMAIPLLPVCPAVTLLGQQATALLQTSQTSTAHHLPTSRLEMGEA